MNYVFKNLLKGEKEQNKKNKGNKENKESEESEEKEEKKVNEKRMFMIDLMIKKLKTAASNFILNRFNFYKGKEIKDLKEVNYDLINLPIKSDFNLEYFNQHLYSILSNETKYKNYKNHNYLVIKEIIDSYNKNKEYLLLVKILNEKFIDNLDYFRYNKEDEAGNFNEKLIEFLIKEYKEFDPKKLGLEQKYEKNGILIQKDYICSLLFLCFNLERAFYLKKPRNFKENKK